MNDAPVVMVTGARVGIGLATAMAFAEVGARVAITSRPAPERDGHPLSQAVASVEAAGGEATGVGMDLSDRDSIASAVASVLDRWGRIDVLVNNALCDQAGAQARLADTDYAAFERMIIGEVVNTAYLTTRVLAQPTSGIITVINVGSAAADYVPPAPIGEGGWAYSYAATKAALHRLAGFLPLEYGAERVRTFTLNPGVVRTERLLERLGDLPGSVDPKVPAVVMRWLALDPEAEGLAGQHLHAQKIAKEKGWLQ